MIRALDTYTSLFTSSAMMETFSQAAAYRQAFPISTNHEALQLKNQHRDATMEIAYYQP
jgi:hypothetical protein